MRLAAAAGFRGVGVGRAGSCCPLAPSKVQLVELDGNRALGLCRLAAADVAKARRLDADQAGDLANRQADIHQVIDALLPCDVFVHGASMFAAPNACQAFVAGILRRMATSRRAVAVVSVR